MDERKNKDENRTFLPENGIIGETGMDEQECIWQGVLYRQTVLDLLYANPAVTQLYLLTGEDPHIIIQARGKYTA